MNGNGKRRLLAAAVLAAALAACGGTENPRVAAGGSGGETSPGGSGGSGGDGGTGGTGEGGTGPGGTGGETPTGITASDSWGGVWGMGSARATLAGQNVPVDLFGHEGATVPDPAILGFRGVETNYWGAVVGCGITVLDRRTGRARVLTSDDGLPQTAFSTGPDPHLFPMHTVPILDMAWIEPDRLFAAAAFEHLVIGRIDDAGAVSFTSMPIHEPERAIVTQVAAVEGKVWVGSGMGLVVVDPTLMEEERWVDMAVPADESMVHGIASADLNGTHVAALTGDRFNIRHAIVIDEDGTRKIEFPAREVPVSVGAAPGVLLFGTVSTRGALGSIYALHAGSDVLEPFLPVERLWSENSGNLVPRTIGYDAARSRILVGGHGHNVVAFPFDEATRNVGDGVAFFDRRDDRRFAVPNVITSFAIDGGGDLYVSGSWNAEHPELSHELPLRWELGDDGDVRMVRPFLGGVRAIVDDPNGGAPWVVVRDESGAFHHTGFAASSALCRLRGDGTCELYSTAINTDNTQDYYPTSGAIGVAFGNPAAREMLIATQFAGVVTRIGDLTRYQNVPMGLRLARRLFSWSLRDGVMWLGSSGNVDGSNDPVLNDRTPHGFGLVELDEQGVPTFIRRYVRNLGLDPRNTPVHEVAGMPSNQAYDHEVLPGRRHALVALGVERMDLPVDHYPLADEAPYGSAAGIVEVEDETITTYLPPLGLAFTDIVDLARRPDGTFLALDAAAGVFTVDTETDQVRTFAVAPWRHPERALSIAVDGQGRVAVGTNRGIWLWQPDGTVLKPVAHGASGYVWTVRFVGDGVLYAGTDVGLLRFALDGATLPPLGPTGPIEREPWPLPPGCDGADGCPCSSWDDCSPDLTCYCLEADCRCLDHDPCLDTPGLVGCTCSVQEDCVLPRTCEFEDGNRICVFCNGKEGCACDALRPCSLGFVCGEGGTCERAPCTVDCTCDSNTGCPEDELCDPRLESPTCTRDWIECQNGCTCPTMNGCPQGLTCAGDPPYQFCGRTLEE